MSVLKINEGNFEEEVLKSEKMVLIDFYADWCGPCRMMSPIIDEIAEELKESVKVAIKYDVMSIPTIIIFKNGMPVKTFLGVTDKNEILENLK